MLFDRICRDNGIIHRLTQPGVADHDREGGAVPPDAAPGAARRRGPFADLAAAQAAVDAWVVEYNTRRPHQSLDMAFPARPVPHRDAVAAAAERGRTLIPLRLPGFLSDAVVPASRPVRPSRCRPTGQLAGPPSCGRHADRPGARRPPATAGVGHRGAAGRTQGPQHGRARVRPRRRWSSTGWCPRRGTWRCWANSSGSVRPAPGRWSRFWADTQVIHLCIAGARVKIGPLAPVHRRPGHPGPARCPPGRAVTPPRTEPARPRRAGHRPLEVDRAARHRRLGRQRRQPPHQRPRAAGRHPHRHPRSTPHADRVRHRHPRTAAGRTQPADPGRDRQAARCSPSRTATPTSHRAGRRAATRLQHRRDQRLRPEGPRSAGNTPARP